MKLRCSGNNDGDTFEIELLEDGRVALLVEHCCIREIDHVVPVEFVTALLSKAVREAGGIREAMRAVGWPQDYTAQLVSLIEDRQ